MAFIKMSIISFNLLKYQGIGVPMPLFIAVSVYLLSEKIINTYPKLGFGSTVQVN